MPKTRSFKFVTALVVLAVAVAAHAEGPAKNHPRLFADLADRPLFGAQGQKHKVSLSPVEVRSYDLTCGSVGDSLFDAVEFDSPELRPNINNSNFDEPWYRNEEKLVTYVAVAIFLLLLL